MRGGEKCLFSALFGVEDLMQKSGLDVGVLVPDHGATRYPVGLLQCKLLRVVSVHPDPEIRPYIIQIIELQSLISKLVHREAG